MLLQPLPALTDNYIWTLVDDAPGSSRRAVIVDPGEAAPVLQAGDAGLQPIAILLTHHHPDHIGGTAALVQRWPELAVYAPADEHIQFPCQRVSEGDRVAVGGWEFEVIALPGHTLSHIAYAGAGCVFCGDTLFSLGCGRMFEGTPTQMLGSLDRLAALPADTRVCCGHEYTVANAAFAQAVDPGNPVLRQRAEQAVAQRQAGQPTVPTTMANELACNPFLRVGSDAIRASITARLGREPKDRVETFAELRSWKDGFRT
jgi:hydroxyacylglutathione hydrolase